MSCTTVKPGTRHQVPGISQPPRPIFHGRYLDSWNSPSSEKLGVGDTSLRALRRRTVRFWYPFGLFLFLFLFLSSGGWVRRKLKLPHFPRIRLVVEHSTLENRPKGGDRHRRIRHRVHVKSNNSGSGMPGIALPFLL